MKGIVSKKIISIIFPNFDVERMQEVKENIALVIPAGFTAKYIFVVEKSNEKPSTDCFVECKPHCSYNEQVTRAFEYASGECVIICDTISKRYVDYVKEMILNWLSGAKIVRLKREKPTKFWTKLANFFSTLKNKIYNFFLRLHGLTYDHLCINSYQLFDKQVYELIKSLPEKNAYLRNCGEFNYFQSVEMETNENIKLINNTLAWSPKLIVSTVLLGLFVTFFVLAFVLYPVAKRNTVNYTFVSLMILILFGLAIGMIGFFYSALIDNKLGFSARTGNVKENVSQAIVGPKIEPSVEVAPVVLEPVKKPARKPAVRKAKVEEKPQQPKVEEVVQEPKVDEPKVVEPEKIEPPVVDKPEPIETPQVIEPEPVAEKGVQEESVAKEKTPYKKRTRKHNTGPRKTRIKEIIKDDKKVISVIK